MARVWFPWKKKGFSLHPTPKEPTRLGCTEAPGSRACPHLLKLEPREERWEHVPVLSARQEQLQAPTGSCGPRGHWELQPRQGAAPWEPGLIGQIQARTQGREQPASTSWDTGSRDGIQDWSHLPLFRRDGKCNTMGFPLPHSMGLGCRALLQGPDQRWEGAFFFPGKLAYLQRTDCHGGLWESGGLSTKQDLFCIGPGHISPPSLSQTLSPRLHLRTPKKALWFVVCFLQAGMGWEPAGKSNQGCGKG